MVLVFILIIPQNIYSQGVKSTQDDETPYLLNDEGENFTASRGLFSRKKKGNLSRATSVYMLVHPGPNGRIDNMSADDLARTGLQKELRFPSLYFTLSAAVNPAVLSLI